MKKNIATLFMANSTTFTILFLLLTLFTSSCGKDDKKSEISSSAIVGTWYFAEGKEYFQPNGGTKKVMDTDEADPTTTLQFKSDGTVISKNNDTGSENGTYVLGANTLTVKFANPDLGTQTATVLQLNNTTLVIEDKETGTDDDVPGTWYYEYTYKKK